MVLTTLTVVVLSTLTVVVLSTCDAVANYFLQLSAVSGLLDGV